MRRAQGFATLAAFVLIAIAAILLRPAPTPGPFLRDFEAYWSAGHTRNVHADPYGTAIYTAERSVAGVDARRDELLPFVGPPATLLLWSALAALPYDVAASLWYTVLVVAAFALVAATLHASGVRFAPVSSTAATVLPAVAATAAFGPLTSDLALGQIALVAYLGATLVATPVARAARSSLLSFAGAFLALLQPNVAIGLVSQFDRRRTATEVVFAAAASYAVGVVVAGWNWPLHYARQLSAHGWSERWSVIQMTPVAIAHGAGSSVPAASFVALSLALTAIGAAIAIWRRCDDPFTRFAAFSALVPFVSSFFHEHDLIVAYAAVLWCALRAQAIARGIALAGSLLLAIDWLGLAQRPGGIPQSALLAIAFACAFLAMGGHAPTVRSEPIAMRSRATTAALSCVAVLFAAAASIAVVHPAPVWPDALGHFHALPNATIAQTWFAEQQRSGLLAVNPVWAALRALSLLGCALVAIAIYGSTPKQRHPKRSSQSERSRRTNLSS